MKKLLNHQTAIIFLEEKSSQQIFFKQWLGENNYISNETADINEAIENISDFTQRSRPDIVLLKVASLKKDFTNLRQMICLFSGKTNLPVFALCDQEKVITDNDCFVGNFAEIKFQIERFFSKFARPIKISQSA